MTILKRHNLEIVTLLERHNVEIVTFLERHNVETSDVFKKLRSMRNSTLEAILRGKAASDEFLTLLLILNRAKLTTYQKFSDQCRVPLSRNPTKSR